MGEIKSFFEKIEKLRLRAIIFTLIIVGFVVYFRSLFGEFLWDDLETIPQNPAIQHIQNIPYFFTRSVFYSPAANDLIGLYYRPFHTTVAALIYPIWGLNTFGYHLFDLIIHILNSVLIFFLIKRLLDLGKFSFAKTASFFSSLLFLLHPANVESVAYVSGMTDVMSASFLIISLHFALSYGLDKKNRALNLIGLIFFTLLCLFSKESGILSVCLIFLIALLFFWKKIPILFLSLVLPVGIYLYFRFHVVQLSSSYNTSIIPIFNATIWQRLFVLPYELFSYLRLIFFPLDLHVGEQGIIKNIADPKFYISLTVVLIFITFLVFIFKKVKSKVSLFFIFWVIVSLLPFLNIFFPLDFTIEERWLYIPLIGVVGFFGICFSKIISSTKYQKILFYVLCIYLLFFTLRTFVRTFDWANELALFGHDVNYVKNSSELYTNYANSLYRAGEIEKSKEQFGNAINLAPDNFYALNNLGSIYAQQGQYEKAKNLFEKSAKVAPTTQTLENICLIDFLTQKSQQVIECSGQALKMFPNSAKLNQLMALSLFAEGQKEEAKIYAQKSLQFDGSQENINTLSKVLQ